VVASSGATDGVRHLAYTLAPDGQSLISGGSGGQLIAYDLQGKELGRFVGHESEVWAVTHSPDGRLLVSGSHDQTLRLWNLKTRELIVTLFHGSDGEWVMWTPQGYYTGSPGADKMVGWQINKGPENAADYVGADQLREHLNRPDIIDKAIVLASAEQAVREAPGTSSFKLADLQTRPVPRYRIVSPAPDSTQRGAPSRRS
jgi:WD40 repeat protein